MEAKPSHTGRLILPHSPSVAAMHATLRCHAHARTTGKQCRSPAVKGKRVCRMHGGGKGSGAPSGEANGSFVHGGWTHEAVAVRREASALLRSIKEAAA